MINTYWKL